MRALPLILLSLAAAASAQPVRLTNFESSGADGVERVTPGVGIVSVDGILYFPAEGPGNLKPSLWQHSLETGATSLAASFGVASARETAAVGGRVYVAVSSGSGPPTIQEYDPQTGLTRAVYTTSKPGDIALTAVGSRLFLIDRTPDNLDAPHLLDAATGQATRVADVSFGGITGGVRAIGQTVYYGATDASGSGTIWATEAPSGATAEIAVGFEATSLPVAFDGALYAGAFPDSGLGFGLLRKSLADGTATLIELVVDGERLDQFAPLAATDDRLLLIGSRNSVTTIYTYTDSGGATALCSPGGAVGVAGPGLEPVVVGELVYLTAVVRDSDFNTSGLDPATLNAETCAIDLLFPDAPFDGVGSFQNGYLQANGNLYAAVRPRPSTSVTTELYAVATAPLDPVVLLIQEPVTAADETTLMEALALLLQESVTAADDASLFEALQIVLREGVSAQDALDIVGPDQALGARFLSVDGLFDFGPDVALQIDASGLEGMGDVLALHVENGAGVLDDRWTLATDDALALGPETTLRFQLGALDGPALSNPAGALVVYGPDSATPTPLAATYNAAGDALVVAWPGEGEFAVLDGGPVSTEDGPPVAFGLGAPYPNPAFGQLTVSYDVPAPADVRVTVYDALGRRVATLAEGLHRAGAFTVGVGTSAFAPGLYLVRMESDGFGAARQVVVAR